MEGSNSDTFQYGHKQLGVLNNKLRKALALVLLKVFNLVKYMELPGREWKRWNYGKSGGNKGKEGARKWLGLVGYVRRGQRNTPIIRKSKSLCLFARQLRSQAGLTSETGTLEITITSNASKRRTS